jgi:hypothetical protein
MLPTTKVRESLASLAEVQYTVADNALVTAQLYGNVWKVTRSRKESVALVGCFGIDDWRVVAAISQVPFIPLAVLRQMSAAVRDDIAWANIVNDALRRAGLGHLLEMAS